MDGVRRVTYFNHNTLKSGCGNRMSAYVTTSDRKCDAEMLTFREYSAGGCTGCYCYRYGVQWISRGYKKNIWGNWKEYNTAHNYQNVGFTVSAPVVTGYDGIRSIFYYSNYSYFYSFGSTSSDVWKMTWWTYVGNRVENITIPPDPLFIRVKGEFSTRGIGDRWAIINCGY